MLEDEPTGQRGRMAIRSDPNVLEEEKIMSLIYRKPIEIEP